MLEQLAEALTKWNEREHGARSSDDKESRPATNPHKTLMGQLYGWMHQFPVIVFNSGKYDLNAIKQFLVLYFLSTSKTEEQLHSPGVQLLQVSESVWMRGDERSFPIRVHGLSGEVRRHHSSIEIGLLQSTEERWYFQ